MMNIRRSVLVVAAILIAATVGFQLMARRSHERAKRILPPAFSRHKAAPGSAGRLTVIPSANSSAVGGGLGSNEKLLPDVRTATGSVATVQAGGDVVPEVASAVASHDLNYQVRIREINANGDNLRPEAINELKKLADTKAGDCPEMLPDQFLAVRNDVLDKLINQNVLPDGLGKFMVDMYRDRQHEEVWRDYCVQHFATYYEKKWPAGAAGNDSEAGLMRKAYWEAVEEAAGTIAGTALLGLERISRIDEQVDRKKVAGKAIAYVLNEDCPELARVTALQVCAAMGETSILSVARRLANDSQRQGLQLSSIAVLGELGSAGDLAVLKEIMQLSGGTPAGKSAEAALRQISARGAGGR